MDELVTLLREDATQNMPPYEMWLQGRDDIAAWMLGPGHGCRGSRVQPLEVNGAPAFAQWRPDGAGGFEPWAIHVLDVSGGRVSGISSFLDTRLFALFGLPEHRTD
jgi:RNA polymerase sigma-70 factor (ECF subfamily)